jgi:hypothetical protein
MDDVCFQVESHKSWCLMWFVYFIPFFSISLQFKISICHNKVVLDVSRFWICICICIFFLFITPLCFNILSIEFSLIICLWTYAFKLNYINPVVFCAIHLLLSVFFSTLFYFFLAKTSNYHNKLVSKFIMTICLWIFMQRILMEKNSKKISL